MSWFRSLRASAALCPLVAIILAATSGGDTVRAQQGHRQVLVLHATRPDAQVTMIAEAELPRALNAEFDGNVDYYSEFIDVARFPDTSYRAAFANLLRVKYRARRFDLVIGLGDAVVELVESNRRALFRDTPMVFLANNRATRGGPDSTGLILERNFGATVPLIQKLQPDVMQVFIVSGAAAADRAYEQLVRTQFRPYESRLIFTYLSALPTEELERRLAALPPRSAVFYTLVSQDGAGRKFHPLDYINRVAAVATVPTYSWVDSALDHGIVGGSVYSQRAATSRVARLAIRVLRGERVDSIPIAHLDLNADQVDWRQLQRWGIPEARVPEGALVRFREPGVWGRYKAYLIAGIGVFLLQTVLIAGLLVQRQQRQRAERELRRRQAELEASYGRIHDLGGRLLNAQEAERGRIARELHDDINQQLSLLAIDLAMLRGVARPQALELIDAASSRTGSIISSVHDLSRRLHPYKLQLIGLVAALADLQHAVSQAGIAITFTHENVPTRLPQDLTLSLFRIVQESLQNALKHSHARSVSMTLIGRPTELELTIVDDGIGFDVDAAWGEGLGLVGIRERLDAIGGYFEIHSQPGAGTRLEIRVPLNVIEDTKSSAASDFRGNTLQRT
jgi:signal transduction histidine kinase